MAARIVAVCNQKGGVGKTTVVTGLAEVYTRRLMKKVLVIDADPQRNTTSALGVTHPEFTLNDVLYGDAEQNQKIIAGVAGEALIAAGEEWQSDGAQLDFIASERNLASRERDSMMARERRLRTSLKGVAENYDIVLIDCPPALGLLTVNALTAATHALMVTEPRVSSVEGLTEIVTTIAEVQENLNEDLDVVGLVINKVRKGRSDQAHWIERIRRDFGDTVLEPFLPDRELFARSQAAAKPLSDFGSAAKPLIDDLELLARSIWKGSGS